MEGGGKQRRADAGGLSGRRLRGEAKPERHHVGHGERPLAEAIAIGAAFGAGIQDMPEGVGAGIAVVLGVGRAAYAEGIENEQESARHGCHHC